MHRGILRSVLVFLTLAAGCGTSAGAKRGDVAVSDAWINTRAENELTPQFARNEAVTVSTQNGVVFLDGHVTSVERAERYEKIVTEIRGVREVKNNLVVKP